MRMFEAKGDRKLLKERIRTYESKLAPAERFARSRWLIAALVLGAFALGVHIGKVVL